jgi:hypothetical protein
MTKDPFDVNQVSFDHIYEQIDPELITRMIMAVDVTGTDGFYIDCEIDKMTPAMRRQLLNQIMTLVTTYKRLCDLL